MRRHEERCTMNPNRKCGMCSFTKQTQPKLKDLIEILPNPKDYPSTYEGVPNWRGLFDEEKLRMAVISKINDLRKASGDCPACIMAALRQSGIPVYLAEGFHFSDECKEIFLTINNELALRECGNY